MVHICAWTSYFLKAAVIHHFPSRVWLDAAVLRCCLFPVHCSRFTKNIETRVVVVYPCCLQKISIHFACFPTSIELAFGSNSDACYGTQTCSLRNFLKAAVLHYFPSRVEPEQKKEESAVAFLLFLLVYKQVLLAETAAQQEGFHRGLGATKSNVEVHGVAGAALAEDVFTEAFGGSLVEDAFFFEEGIGIGIEDFGPFVAVVAGGIASVEDVSEGGTETAARHFGKKLGFGHGGFLKTDGVGGNGFGNGVPGHVVEAEAELTNGEVATLEIIGSNNFLNEVFRHGLSGLVVNGHILEPFLFQGPVFHNL